jgi:hypothetical protein
MSKQREVNIAPVRNEAGQAHDGHSIPPDLEREQQAPTHIQSGVYKADLLHKAWTKQFLILVFAG